MRRREEDDAGRGGGRNIAWSIGIQVARPRSEKVKARRGLYVGVRKRGCKVVRRQTVAERAMREW